MKVRVLDHFANRESNNVDSINIALCFCLYVTCLFIHYQYGNNIGIYSIFNYYIQCILYR